MSISRRAFMGRAAAVGAGFAGLHAVMGRGWARALARGDPAGYGPLVKDPAGLVDLPAGFSYSVFSRQGEEMDDGLLVPGQHDGMGAFPGPDGLTLLVRNHENESEWVKASPFGARAERLAKVDPGRVYDAGFGRTPGLGGTTTLVYDTRTGVLVRHFLSLAGTLRNCAGGPTPWGTWLSCEEDVHRATGPLGMYEKDHGYVFEVRPSAEPALALARPLEAMGRFYHEAVAVDLRSGVVLLTEDRGDGLIYRFLPTQPGWLEMGGRLQALAVRGRPGLDTRNWKPEVGGAGRTVAVGEGLDVEWIDLRDIHAPEDDLRERGAAAGAAVFARGEGMWAGRDGIYWACTDGGGERAGQIWRYRPSRAEGADGERDAPGRLELFIEPDDATILHNADNITFAPWGDMIVCEDNGRVNRLLGITPGGEVYPLARHAAGNAEFAGATFSPDGSTLFVNIQTPGATLAIRGPWKT